MEESSGGKKGERLRVRFSDREGLQEARTILTYEAAVRGLTIGQALCELVMDAADVDGYPDELRERLAEIAEESSRRAVRRSLRMAK